jgi:transcriptional regulator with XRE-family HTH domain
MDYEKLGARIREERLRLRLTQAALAEAIDISTTYMGSIERGERSLTLGTLERLVNRLGVTIDYVLADSVSEDNAYLTEQFRQIIDKQPLERKEMAISILRIIFSYFEKEDQS